MYPNFNALPAHVQFHIAEGMLMTGPRAQKPTARAVRKTIKRMRDGKPVKGGWRSWPSN